MQIKIAHSRLHVTPEAHKLQHALDRLDAAVLANREAASALEALNLPYRDLSTAAAEIRMFAGGQSELRWVIAG